MFTDDKVVATVDVIKEKLQVDDTIRTGFHWPPFNTVNHLHLHFISPVENLSLLHRTMFKENSLWFVSVSSDQFLYPYSFILHS